MAEGKHLLEPIPQLPVWRNHGRRPHRRQGEGFARAGDAQKSLRRESLLHTMRKLGNSLGLVARGIILRIKNEIHK